MESGGFPCSVHVLSDDYDDDTHTKEKKMFWIGLDLVCCCVYVCTRHVQGGWWWVDCVLALVCSLGYWLLFRLRGTPLSYLGEAWLRQARYVMLLLDLSPFAVCLWHWYIPPRHAWSRLRLGLFNTTSPPNMRNPPILSARCPAPA